MITAASVNLENFEYNAENYKIMHKHIWKSYGVVAKDLTQSMHQVCRFIRNCFNNVSYKVKTNNVGISEKMMLEADSYTVGIGITENHTDTIMYCNEIYADEVMNEFKQFYINSDNNDLKKASTSLEVYLKSLLAGEIYGSIEITSDEFMLSVDKFDNDCKPIHAVLIVHNGK